MNMKKTKNMKAAVGKYDAMKSYPIDEAVALVQEMKYSKFDESVDMVCDAINNYQEQQIVLDTDKVMITWFGEGDKTGEPV